MRSSARRSAAWGSYGGVGEDANERNPDLIRAERAASLRPPFSLRVLRYFQKFAPGQLIFSYDLADCVTRYLETERLATHWREVLPLPMLDLEYEALVADLEGECRRLIAFLSLDWEPVCLDFHRTTRTVTTASSWQVRQPLYDCSVGRWRNYQRHFVPLLEVLAKAAAGTVRGAAIRLDEAPNSGDTEGAHGEAR